MSLAARLILAAVFGVAALAKLADRLGSEQAARDFGVPERLAGPVAVVIPVAELLAAGLLLVPQSARAGSVLALALLGLFSAGIIRAMSHGEAPDCHCFGTLHSEPAGVRTLMRNGLLIAIAVVPLAAASPGASPWRWIDGLDTTQTWLLAAVVALAVALAAQSAFLVSLLRQHGRILIRLDALELGSASPGAAVPGQAGYGLPVGDPAPDFELPDVTGRPVALAYLRAAGRPVLLLFTDPECGPCSALMPEIAGWQREYTDVVTIALVSRGSAREHDAEVREHGLANVLLQADRETAEAFNCQATPSALLVGAEGAVAAPAAAGAEAIKALVAAAVNEGPPDLEVIRSTVSALQIGAPAPQLSLHDLDGKPIELSDPDAGHRLLLFWNPACGFCQTMVSDLRRWESRTRKDAPELVLLSAGTAADNRALEFRSRIVLDPSFTAGSLFGATGTPSAILLDPGGRVHAPLSVGAPAVMALANHATLTASSD
jgi:methylamine dehydrogenase accessory protein MauD